MISSQLKCRQYEKRTYRLNSRQVGSFKSCLNGTNLKIMQHSQAKWLINLPATMKLVEEGVRQHQQFLKMWRHCCQRLRMMQCCQ